MRQATFTVGFVIGAILTACVFLVGSSNMPEPVPDPIVLDGPGPAVLCFDFAADIKIIEEALDCIVILETEDAPTSVQFVFADKDTEEVMPLLAQTFVPTDDSD